MTTALDRPAPCPQSEPTVRCNQRGDRFVLATTILGSSMAFIDGTVVNVALPMIQRDLDADMAGLQWIVEAYLLCLTALMLVGGTLGDHFGRRRMFVAGVAVFAVASIACGLAQNVPQLIAARTLQGIGGALLIPGSLAIITNHFDERRRGRAIGIWSAFTSITVALAPLIGGYLIDAVGWRWIFYINVPLAVVVIALAQAGVPESRDEEAEGGIDWIGAGLATVGLAGLVLALIESARLGIAHPAVWLSGAVGVAALVLFVVAERRLKHPMIPRGLFRNPVFTGANLVTLALYAGLGAALFFLPLHMISVLGYTALEAGLALLPFIIILSALSRASGSLVDRIGARQPLILGPAITGIGFALLAAPGLTSSYWTGFMPAIVVMGLGMALTVAPLTTAAMNAAPPGHTGVASAVNNAVSRLAFLLAVAVLGAVAVSQFVGALDNALVERGFGPEALAAFGDEVLKLGGAVAPEGLADPQGVIGNAIAEAALTSFRLMMLVCAALALLASVIAWGTIDRQPQTVPVPS